MRNSFIFALIIFFMLLIIPTIALSYLENKIDSNNKEVATAPPPKIQILETPKAVKAEPYMIKVYDINTNETIAMDFEEYIKGVVASEMPAEFADEALKAQAVAARTYLLYRIKKYPDGQPEHSEASICTGIHCQVWSSKEKLISNHPEGWYNTYWSKIESAVESTASQVITYDAKIIEPLFHSASGGRTENSEDVFSASVPYLRSVDSPYEADAPKLHDSLKLSANDFINKIKSIYGELNLNPDNLKSVLKLTDVSAGGKVKKHKYLWH